MGISLNFAIGISTLIIIMGIMMAGSLNEGGLQSFDYDKLIVWGDNNITPMVEKSFQDSNLTVGKEHLVNAGKYVSKTIVYGIGLDVAVGYFINDYCPGLYKWIKENPIPTILILILLVVPQILVLLVYVFLALLLWIKEKYFKRKRKKVLRWI